MHSEASQLWQWDAADIAVAVRERRVSAVEVAQAHLDRITEVNPALNALVVVAADEAIDDAERVDALVAAGVDPGLLAGVPVAIKVNTDQAGHATTHGIRLLEHAVAVEDAPVVHNLRAAGAVPIGRGNSPAFGYRAFTSNALHGTTLSPWSQTHTPGGSSGGSSVAVSTGMAALGQGNDLAGSIRYPAYACGLFGLRPTVGRVPRGSRLSGLGESLMSQLMTVDGPLARSAQDLELMFSAMANEGDPRDLFWTPAARASDPPREIAVLRQGASPIHPTVGASLDLAAQLLADAGYAVSEVDVPQLDEAYRLWWYLCLSEYQNADQLLDDAGDSVAATVVRNYAAIAASWWPAGSDLASYLAAHSRRQVLIQELQELMGRRILLMPISSEPVFEHDLDADNTERFMRANWSMMALPAVALPGLAVPLGLADGLPTGVQLVGQRHDDYALIAAGAAIEARTGRITPTGISWQTVS